MKIKTLAKEIIFWTILPTVITFGALLIWSCTEKATKESRNE